MDRLHRKGVLERRKVGRAFVYRPVSSREELESGLVTRALQPLLQGDSAQPILSCLRRRSEPPGRPPARRARAAGAREAPAAGGAMTVLVPRPPLITLSASRSSRRWRLGAGGLVRAGPGAALRALRAGGARGVLFRLRMLPAACAARRARSASRSRSSCGSSPATTDETLARTLIVLAAAGVALLARGAWRAGRGLARDRRDRPPDWRARGRRLDDFDAPMPVFAIDESFPTVAVVGVLASGALHRRARAARVHRRRSPRDGAARVRARHAYATTSSAS